MQLVVATLHPNPLPELGVVDAFDPPKCLGRHLPPNSACPSYDIVHDIRKDGELLVPSVHKLAFANHSFRSIDICGNYDR